MAVGSSSSSSSSSSSARSFIYYSDILAEESRRATINPTASAPTPSPRVTYPSDGSETTPSFQFRSTTTSTRSFQPVYTTLYPTHAPSITSTSTPLRTTLPSTTPTTTTTSLPTTSTPPTSNITFISIAIAIPTLVLLSGLLWWFLRKRSKLTPPNPDPENPTIPETSSYASLHSTPYASLHSTPYASLHSTPYASSLRSTPVYPPPTPVELPTERYSRNLIAGPPYGTGEMLVQPSPLPPTPPTPPTPPDAVAIRTGSWGEGQLPSKEQVEEEIRLWELGQARIKFVKEAWERRGKEGGAKRGSRGRRR